AELHAACQPGGQLFQDRWMLSSLTMTDFLLAAMVVCLDLYESYNSTSSPSASALIARAEKHDALKVSRDFWLDRSATSRDARRASNILTALLSKLQRPATAGPSSDPSKGGMSGHEYLQMNSSVDGVDTHILAEITGDDSDPAMLNHHNDPLNNEASESSMDLDSFEDIFRQTDDIDW
ncbi:hypothetical protein LTS18_006047, partial [Coniosporium uncinatum]